MENVMTLMLVWGAGSMLRSCLTNYEDWDYKNQPHLFWLAAYEIMLWPIDMLTRYIKMKLWMMGALPWDNSTTTSSEPTATKINPLE